MKTAQDLINECNQKERLPFSTEQGWALIGAGLIGGIIGAIIYNAIISPFCK